MKKIAFFIMIIFSFTLIGCWDSVETEELGVVTLLGFKLTNNDIEVYVQELSNRGESASNQPSGVGKTPIYVYSASGETITEAIQKISANQHQKLYFSHTKVLIIDEDLASSEGIQPIIDFCERTLDIRISSYVLVSKHNVIDKIFNTNTTLKTDTGTLLEEKINNNTSILSFNTNNIKDIIESTDMIGSDTYTAGIDVSFTSLSKTSSANEFNIIDTAIFKGCKMVGWLDNEESIGLACVNKKTHGTIFTVQFKGKSVSLKTLRINSKVKPKIIDGKMQINISVNVESNVAESHVNTNLTDDKSLRTLEQLLSEKIKEEIISSIEESKTLKSDIFGFGNYIDMDFHSYWATIQYKWRKIYPDIKVNVTVNARIKNVGKVYKTLQ